MLSALYFMLGTGCPAPQQPFPIKVSSGIEEKIRDAESAEVLQKEKPHESLPPGALIPWKEAVNLRIQKFYDRYHQGRKQKDLEHKIKKAGRFQDLYEKIGKKYDIPPILLNALAIVESGGNPKVKSAKGARGLLQLMPSTARGISRNYKSYGRKERIYCSRDWRKPEVSIECGAMLLNWFRNKYQKMSDNENWKLDENEILDFSLASYNWSTKRLDKALKISGRHTYWRMHWYLPWEVNRFIPKIRAIEIYLKEKKVKIDGQAY